MSRVPRLVSFSTSFASNFGLVAAAAVVTNLNAGLHVADYLPVVILSMMAAIIASALLGLGGKPVGTGRVLAGQALTLSIMAAWLILT